MTDTSLPEEGLLLLANPLCQAIVKSCLAAACQLYPVRICHMIVEATHIHLLLDDAPLISQPMEIKGGVSIGAHAWLGARVTIMDGVKIGEHAVVGAHFFVKDDVPDYAVVVGTPAKIVASRKPLGHSSQS